MRIKSDIVSGAVLSGIGAFAVVYAFNNLAIGTQARMGPGLFPVVIGSAMSLLGVIIFVRGFFQSARPVIIDWRPLLAVVSSILIFAMLIRPFGLLPATLALVLTACLASSKNSIRKAVLLSVSLSAGAVALFVFGLGLQFSVIKGAW